MARFEGRLVDAPVVYVLCQIRFSPVEKMAEYVPAIQDALRPQYPVFETEQLGGVRMGPRGQPMFIQQNETRWRFETRDSRTGFMLSTSQLITHTTNYVDSADFRERIVFGFRTMHEIVKVGFIQRIGLRYIDMIIPRPEESMDDYVHASLVGFRPQVLGLTPEISQQFLQTRSTMGGVLMMKASRARHSMALPGDLFPTPLKLNREPPTEQDSMLLDWDHYVDALNMDPDPNALADIVRKLKAPIATIFQEAITDHAVRVWQRQR